MTFTFVFDLLAATPRNATPLVYGTVGETYSERSGVLNLGIEGTMYAGAFAGFAVAFTTGSPFLGLVAALVVGGLAGAVMALLTVPLGANQHVSGIGLTIGLIGISEFANRLLFQGGELRRIEPMPLLEPLAFLGAPGEIFHQYGLTYIAFLVVVPLAWWVLQRSSFGLEIRAVGDNPEAGEAAGGNLGPPAWWAPQRPSLGLGCRAVGDNPEAADAAGINVGRTRYLALKIGGALMGIGGAFFTLAVLGSFPRG